MVLSMKSDICSTTSFSSESPASHPLAGSQSMGFIPKASRRMFTSPKWFPEQNASPIAAGLQWITCRTGTSLYTLVNMESICFRIRRALVPHHAKTRPLHCGSSAFCFALRISSTILWTTGSQNFACAPTYRDLSLLAVSAALSSKHPWARIEVNHSGGSTIFSRRRITRISLTGVDRGVLNFQPRADLIIHRMLVTCPKRFIFH
mmetsp:Transcript_4920/g.11794  ORF Transcript_4920/g.11794 Transcript_4920/m.11794 type:complete len:205 (+) Transcript_4920:396-1010(+)